MRLDLSSILLIVAVILFVLVAIGIDLGTLNLLALGLACFAGSFLVGRGGLDLGR
jgi:hypothetical protein